MQENWPVAGSSDSMLSINPGCAWIRGKNSLLRPALNSPTLAGSIVQLTMREYMVASLKCLPRWMLGNEERYNPSPAGDGRSRAAGGVQPHAAVQNAFKKRPTSRRLRHAAAPPANSPAARI